MSRARTNRQIIEEFFMRRRVDADAPLDAELKGYVDALLKKMIGELASGAATISAQKEAARLLSLLLTREPGRPRRRVQSSDRPYVDTADWIRAERAARGESSGLEDAISDMVTLEKEEKGFEPSPGTVRRLYKNGLKQCGDFYINYAREIEAKAAAAGMSAETYIVAVAHRDKDREYDLIRYRRGKRQAKARQMENKPR
jgi:hypothetical protein